MKENIKIGLLGIIAFASIINIYLLTSSKEEAETNESQSAIVANNVGGTTTSTSSVLTDGNGTVIQPPVPNPVPNAEPPADMKRTTIRWDNMVHDFGKIKQNSTNTYAFEFTNTGSEPLLITDAKGSCGCTVPDYPKEPVAPGQKAKINVVFKPGVQENQQEKTVTVTANTEPTQTQLKIRAFIEK